MGASRHPGARSGRLRRRRAGRRGRGLGAPAVRVAQTTLPPPLVLRTGRGHKRVPPAARGGGRA
eukprot:4012680-Lingulodinium_polyedra.AAC.1